MDNLVDRLVRGELSLEHLRRASGAEVVRAIRAVGLEDAHEIIHMLTKRQLRETLDDDLWIATPGRDDELDPARFVTWLQVLGEVGKDELGRRLVELDEELLIGVLCRLFHILTDEGWRQVVAMADHPDLVEKRLADVWTTEVGDYAFFARTAEAELAVDALVELHARDKLHCDYVLEACSQLSFERLAGRVSGDLRRSRLDALLSDVSAAREARRSRRGFVSAPDARAWLTAICEQRHETAAPSAAAQGRQLQTPARGGDLMSRLRRLAQVDESAALAAGQELARLANIVAAGADVAERSLRPMEALAAVLAACDIGLELADSRDGAPVGATGPIAVERAFVQGWRELQELRRIAQFAQSTLSSSADPEAQLAADRLRNLTGSAPAHPDIGMDETQEFVASLGDLARLRAWCMSLQKDPSMAAPR